MASKGEPKRLMEVALIGATEDPEVELRAMLPVTMSDSTVTETSLEPRPFTYRTSMGARQTALARPGVFKRRFFAQGDSRIIHCDF
jgi:hypothetical protein